LKDKTTVPLSYLPVDHPLYEKGLPAYAFDVNKGNQLLDEAGWKDADNNPATARVAVNVKNVPAGTKLVLNYAITQAPLRQEMADYFKQSLAQCGIEINITSYNTADFYSAGPDGILFGRKFDLAQFSWSAAKTPPCYLYSSSEIPTAGNGWLGTKYGGVNLTGYSNPEYDTACQAGLSGGLDLSSYQQAHQKVQQILAQDLPSIPLYYVPHIDVTRPDLCGLEVDASARSEFYHLENLDIGACPAN
jgi:peptide/nickel transport system substrate-binding protein